MGKAVIISEHIDGNILASVRDFSIASHGTTYNGEIYARVVVEGFEPVEKLSNDPDLSEQQQALVVECVRRYKEYRAFMTLSNSEHEALRGVISLISVNTSSEKEFLFLTQVVIKELELDIT